MRPLVLASVLAVAVPTTAVAQTINTSCPVVQDTLIRQLTPTTTYNTYTKGWADSAVEGIAGSWIETLLRFDLSTCLPAGARVVSASLNVYVTNASASPIVVDELLRPFTGAATWRQAASGVPWTTEGAMGAGTDYGARLGTIASSALGALSIPLTPSLIQGWVGSATRSIVVRPTGTPGTNNAPLGTGFRSKEHTSGSPPIIRVSYSIADSTAPIISGIVVTPGTRGATVRWSTNEPANGQVAYGLTTSYGSSTPLSSGGLTAHSHTLSNLVPDTQYRYRITSRDGAGNSRLATGSFDTLAETTSATFKVVAWNMHYGKGMTTKAAGMTCPVSGMKDNAQCQIPDNPATPINERNEERRQSAWGTGLTQRYLTGPMVLGDPEVIALLLTEVNSGTCFTQEALMSLVRTFWPDAAITASYMDNWIVARWGFVQGGPNYAKRDFPRCNTTVLGVQWGKIYAADPDPDGDGVPIANPRTLNLFNTHWPGPTFSTDGTPSFCMATATTTRDFMASPAAGIDLSSQPRILGGDLNVEDVVRITDSACEPIGGRAAYDVMRAAGFADAYVAAGAARSTPTADGSTGMVGRPSSEVCYRTVSHNGLFMPYKRIDVQFFKGGAAPGQNLRVLNFELIGVEQFGNCVPSDHMGTKVQYQWY
jgi:hypothetical protein